MDKRPQYGRYEEISQESLNYTSMEETGQELLIITIDIGDGRKDDLTVKEDDDPRVLAEVFCRKHKLGPEVQQALIEQIEQNLELHVEDDISTLLSVNKSFESKTKKSNQESIRSSLGIASENTPIFSKPPRVFENKPKGQEIRQSREIPIFKDQALNNYGERLYSKGIRFIENVNKKKQNFIQERSEKEMKEATFKPIINSNSSERKLVQEMLLKKGKERQENIERKRGEKLAEELSVCTFSPLINKQTEKSYKRVELNSPDRFMRLYDNAKVTQNKIKMINEKLVKQQCPFIPNTQVTKKVTSKLTNVSEKREKISQSRKAIEEYLSSKNATKDPVTGQEFFKPVTGRPPKGRAISSKNIGEYLYSKRSRSQEPKRPSSQLSKLSTQQSEKILHRIKELRYKQLFEELRPDECERISAESVKKSCLSQRTLKILSPLLQEMEDLNEKLNFAEFQESMEILLKSLRPDERSILLKTCKAKAAVPENDFKPKINQSSIMRPKSVESLYQRSMKRQNWNKEKYEQEKKLKAESEMNECTFKPKILKYSVDQSESLDNSGFEPFLPLSGSYYY